MTNIFQDGRNNGLCIFQYIFIAFVVLTLSSFVRIVVINHTENVLSTYKVIPGEIQPSWSSVDGLVSHQVSFETTEDTKGKGKHATFNQSMAKSAQFIIDKGVRRPCGRRGIYANVVYGRLGNQLFQYATLYALALKLNRSAYFSCQTEDYPKHTFPNLPLKYITKSTLQNKNFTKNVEKASAIYSPDLTEVSACEDVHICCYLQSYKYYLGIENEIRKMFVFHVSIRHKAETILQGIIFAARSRFRIKDKRDLTFVGIHVRRGDMATAEKYKFGFRLPSMTYFNKAMNYYRTKYDNVVFVVVGQDASWCVRNLGNNVDLFITQCHSKEVDMATLVACDHIIMTTGTFGWWAGFLAGGTVVYYKDMFYPGSSIGNMTNMDDWVPPHWIGL